MRKNVIIEFDKLPVKLRKALDEKYPYGIDEELINVKQSNNSKEFRAVFLELDNVTYLIKKSNFIQEDPDLDIN